jgi:ATP-dependent Clp protease ATP-binding subunit ClpC
MLALLKEKNLPLVKLLNKNKLSYNNFKKGIINYYNANSKELTDYEKEKIKDMEKQNKENLDNNPIKNSLPFDDDDKNEFTNSGKMKNNRKESTKTPVLDNFCRDISKMAEDNELDPVVGRGIEIKRVSQILARRKKNNPILIGDPGVGKCVTSDTQVVMRDDTTGELFKITISDLLKSIN